MQVFILFGIFNFDKKACFIAIYGRELSNSNIRLALLLIK